MSYILDALKRAESERNRGEVPNIHAQPAMWGESDAPGADGSRMLPALAAVVVGAVLLAALAWWWFSEDTTEPTHLADAAPAVQTAAPPTSPTVVPAGRVTSPTPRTSIAPVTVTPIETPVRKRNPDAAPRTSPSKTTAFAPASAIASTVQTGASDPAAVAAASVGDERVYATKDLPDDIRKSLPALTVGGATYSESPANRMLIINGNIFHEGDKLTPEVTLQQIKLRAAVLSFRGYRYGISY